MIPSKIVPILASTANSAINRALKCGAPALGLHVPTKETEFVAAVLLGALPDIARGWQPELNAQGLSAEFVGVFCHGSPMATFNGHSTNSRTCELADLLVVFEETTGGVVGQRRAVLIQAKMASPGGGKTLTGHGELTQLGLYSGWPRFELGAGFSSGWRDFSTCTYCGNNNHCGRYGLIDKKSHLWHQQSPDRTMPSGGDELGTFLARMISNQHAYGREATGTKDDWSRTVDDLMRITFKRAFAVPGSGSRLQHKRGTSIPMFAVSKEFDGFYIPDDDTGGVRPTNDGIYPPDEGGISLLYVAISRPDGRDSRVDYLP